MKKIIVTAFALAVATLVTQAQAQEKTEGKHDRQGARHHKESFEKLNLSEEQKTKLKSLNADYHKQLQELKKKDDITVKDQKNQIKALRDEHSAKMQGLFTSDQKAQMQKMREEGMEKRKAHSEERMQKMKTNLGLTDDQVAKMKAGRAETSEKMKALQADKSLSDEQRKEQLKDLKKKQMDSMKSILTEDQLKKMKETKHHRSRKPTV